MLVAIMRVVFVAWGVRLKIIVGGFDFWVFEFMKHMFKGPYVTRIIATIGEIFGGIWGNR